MNGIEQQRNNSDAEGGTGKGFPAWLMRTEGKIMKSGQQLVLNTTAVGSAEMKMARGGE